MVWSQIRICQQTTISRIIFAWYWPLKIKISKKNYMVITPSGCLTISAFKISKKLNCGLKIGILKNLVALHTLLKFTSDGTSFRKWLIFKMKKTHFKVKNRARVKIKLNFFLETTKFIYHENLGLLGLFLSKIEWNEKNAPLLQ